MREQCGPGRPTWSVSEAVRQPQAGRSSAEKLSPEAMDWERVKAMPDLCICGRCSIIY